MKRLWIKNDDGLVDVFNVRKHVLDYKPEGFDEKTPLGPRYIEVMLAEDHERIVAELKAECEQLREVVTAPQMQYEEEIAELRAEVERARKESEEMCNRVVFGFQLDRQKLNDDLSEMRAQIDSLRTVLEAVRSQMCWERDRDQLTMGMASLHDDVTKALEKK